MFYPIIPRSRGSCHIIVQKLEVTHIFLLIALTARVSHPESNLSQARLDAQDGRLGS